MSSFMATFSDAELRERLETYVEAMNYHFVVRTDAPKWRKDAIADGVARCRKEMNRRGIS